MTITVTVTVTITVTILNPTLINRFHVHRSENIGICNNCIVDNTSSKSRLNGVPDTHQQWTRLRQEHCFIASFLDSIKCISSKTNLHQWRLNKGGENMAYFGLWRSCAREAAKMSYSLRKVSYFVKMISYWERNSGWRRRGRVGLTIIWVITIIDYHHHYWLSSLTIIIIDHHHWLSLLLLTIIIDHLHHSLLSLLLTIINNIFIDYHLHYWPSYNLKIVAWHSVYDDILDTLRIEFHVHFHQYSLPLT